MPNALKDDFAVSSFAQLFESFKKSVPSPSTQSLLEVIGKENSENVISNLLAFFLDPAAAHNFGSIVLEGFLEAIGVLVSPDNASVEREVEIQSTSERLDIIIDLPEVLIGVEHKIYAGLYNDLQSYRTYLADRAAKHAKRSILLVLAPSSLIYHPDLNEPRVDYKCVTYDECLGSICGRYRAIVCLGNEPYIGYFNELVRTMSKHISPLVSSNQFLSSSANEIQRLLSLQHQVQGHLNYKLNQLKELFKGVARQAKGNGVRFVGIWEGYTDRPLSRLLGLRLVTNWNNQERQITIEAEASFSGWRFIVFPYHERYQGGLKDIEPLQEAPQWKGFDHANYTLESLCHSSTPGRRYKRYVHCKSFDYNADINAIAGFVASLIARDTCVDSRQLHALKNIIQQ